MGKTTDLTEKERQSAISPRVPIYTAETIPEREVARALGIRVAIAWDPKSHATRDLVRQVREGSR